MDEDEDDYTSRYELRSKKRGHNGAPTEQNASTDVPSILAVNTQETNRGVESQQTTF